ncbi:hypothetical protein H5410_005670 [Solanum commersonii]|uniref:Uncharacterized protein n=1 Tax=Solanum commersonii TaxID=4109 RepID=A0A9J6A865_SOLCO|nr:hypothetical protein H5410_005670 [Solanum commersonii]
MTSKSQCNEDAVHEREQEIHKDTANKRDKSRIMDSFSNPPVGGRAMVRMGMVPILANSVRKLPELRLNNVSSLESIAIEGLDEVKGNLIELGEENKEGMTNLELKLTKAISSLHREKGLTDFTIAPMDINTFISLYLNQLHISNVGGSCMIPLIWVPQNKMHLSAMQLVKGFKKGEPTFLVALVGGIENSIEAVALPPCIEQVLLDIKDVMSEEPSAVANAKGS